MTVASFHLTRYPRSQRAFAASRMWYDRAELKATGGLRFWQLLGTARGRSLSLGADLDRWAMFAVWQDLDALAAFQRDSVIAHRWRDSAEETCTVRMSFLSGHGSWDSEFPFESVEADRAEPTPIQPAEPIAVLTRAAIRPSQLVRFYRAVPAVDRELARQPGLMRSVGVGEWPLGRLATFSVWNDVEAMTGFAYRQHHHREVIRRTRAQSWFGEEMFCRFRITAASGTWSGTPVLSPPSTTG